MTVLFKHRIFWLAGAFFFLQIIGANAFPDSLQAATYRGQSIDQLLNSNEDSARYFREKALLIFEKNKSLIACINFYRLTAYHYHTDLNSPEKSLGLYEEFIHKKYWPPSTEKEWDALAWLYVEKANVHKKYFEDFGQAVFYYKKALKIIKEHTTEENSVDVAHYFMLPLANIYTRFGDFDQSIYYLKKVAGTAEKNKLWIRAAKAFNDLGLAFAVQGNHHKADSVFQKGIAVGQGSEVALNMLQANSAINKLQSGKSDEALELIRLAKKGLENIQSENKRKNREAVVHEMMARIYHKRERWDKAEEYFEKAIYSFYEIYHNPNIREIAKLHVDHADLQCDMGKYERALESCQIALRRILPVFAPKNNFTNPTVDLLYAENTIAEALTLKANVLEQLYLKAKNTDYLIAAVDCYKLMLNVWKKLRETYSYESSHYIVLNENRQHLEKAIELSIHLWQEKKEKKYLEDAFYFSQQTKNLFLLETIRAAENSIDINVPDSLLSLQYDLNTKLIWLEKKLLLEKNNTEKSNDEKLRSFEEGIFETKELLSKLRLEIAESCPKCAGRPEEQAAVSVERIQNELSNKAVMLDYFVGDKNIYVLKIVKDGIEIKKIKKDFPLEKWVAEMRDGIIDWKYGPAKNDEQNLKKYIAAAGNLYQVLIASLGELPGSLIIVPDGVLGYIPFDALLLSAPAVIYDYSDYDYLIGEKTISYIYSAALWMKMKKRPTVKNTFLGMAPKFGNKTDKLTGSRGGLGYLKNNIYEVSELSSLMGGQEKINEKATREYFLNTAPDFGIIHLATHAQADDRESKLSYIAFSGAEQEGTAGKIYLLDLFNLQLPVNMVVLSACETGIGKLQKGEGIISLARGFTDAGAKSIVTTLWEVNDESAKNLMPDFYRQLNIGKSKAEALQIAKQQFYENNRDAHPFYWASFIAVGDMSPLEFENGMVWYWGLAGLALIIGIIVVFKRMTFPRRYPS